MDKPSWPPVAGPIGVGTLFVVVTLAFPRGGDLETLGLVLKVALGLWSLYLVVQLFRQILRDDPDFNGESERRFRERHNRPKDS